MGKKGKCKSGGCGKGQRKKKGKKGADCPQSGATTKAAMENLKACGLDIPAGEKPSVTQILVVDCFSVNVSQSADPDHHAAQIFLYGTPHKGSKVTEARLVFTDGSAGGPEYDAKGKRIRISYPVSLFPAVERALSAGGKRLFCHYRKHEDGNCFADIHTGRTHGR